MSGGEDNAPAPGSDATTRERATARGKKSVHVSESVLRLRPSFQSSFLYLQRLHIMLSLGQLSVVGQ